MLMRWAGALLLLAGCSSIGLGRSHELRNRVAKLRTLLVRLERLETEVSLLCTPLPEVLELLCGYSVKTAELRETCFSEIWRREIGKLGFAEEEKKVLEELGVALSRGDVPERAFLAASEELRRILREAENEADRKCRLCSSLGVCAGVLIVIVLI